MGQPRVEMAQVAFARTAGQQRSSQAGVEFRPGYGEHELAAGTEQPRHLRQHGIDVVDVFEDRVRENPVKAAAGLWHLVGADRMNGGIDAQPLSLRGLRVIGIDSNDLAWARFLQQDAGQQTVAAAEVETTTLRQAMLRDLFHLDCAPQRSGGLERVLVQEANEQLAVQCSSASSCSS